ncbi:MAG TPA: DUF4129 domain-containing protein [Anaerolineales bacterium]|nr:DUF4129 domain-containing protein [Anaerolineales bacterium]
MNESPPPPAPRLNPWSEIAGLGVAVMEGSWVALIVLALDERSAAATGLVFFYFSLVFYCAYLLVRFAQGARLAQQPFRVVLVGGYGLFLFIGTRLVLLDGSGGGLSPLTTELRGIEEIARLIPSWLWLAAALLWVYLRGMGAGREGAGSFAVQRHFKFGIVMFLLYGALAFASARELPGLGVFVVFLSATLMAMASARVAVLGRLRGGRRSPFSQKWFWNLVTAVAVTVGAGFSLAMLATGRFALFYRQLLSNIILAVITITLAPFLFIIGLFAGTPVGQVPAPPPTPALPPWEDGGDLVVDFSQPGGFSEYVPPDLRLIYFLALAAAGLLIFVILLRAQTAVRRREGAGEAETMYQSGDLLKELREAFAARRKRSAEALAGRDRLRRGQQVAAAERIRQIYTELIRLAAEFGRPRDPAQTPLEFAEALHGEWPAAAPDLDRITRAYLKIRYGGFPEHADEVRVVEDAWRSVRAAGQARVKAHEQKLKEADRERRRKEKLQ